MLTSALRIRNERSRSGAAPARSLSAGRSSLTLGRAARTNGRISSWMIGVVSTRNGRVSRSAGPSARAPGSSASSAGPSSSASTSVSASAVRVSRSVPGSSATVADRFASCAANAAKTALEFSTNSASWSSLPPSSSTTSEKLWITRLRLRWRLASSPATASESRASGSNRRIVSASGLALPFEPLRAAGEQQLQVRAGVAVEAREDLVDVDVGQRLADRDPLPRAELAGLRGAGRELGHHVLEPRLRAAAGRSRRGRPAPRLRAA